MAAKLATSARLQLVFSRADMARAESLRDQIPTSSIGATLRAAIDLFYMLIMAKKNGARIFFIQEEDGVEQRKEVLIF